MSVIIKAITVYCMADRLLITRCSFFADLKTSGGDETNSTQTLWPGYKFSGELRPYKKVRIFN